MRVLVFGDSIAHGEWDDHGGWVERLTVTFGQRKSFKPRQKYHDFYNLSIDGENSAGVAKRIEQETSARKWPDMPFTILIAIGTNDAGTNPLQHVDVQQYRNNVQSIVDSARTFTDNILFVGLPGVDENRSNPWVEDESISWTNGALREYEQTASAVCENSSVRFMPLHEKFLSEQRKQNLLVDGLHPNDAGHAFIAGFVQPELEKFLKD